MLALNYDNRHFGQMRGRRIPGVLIFILLSLKWVFARHTHSASIALPGWRQARAFAFRAILEILLRHLQQVCPSLPFVCMNSSWYLV